MKAPQSREKRKPRQEEPVGLQTRQDRVQASQRSILEECEKRAAEYEATLDPRDRPLWAKDAAPQDFLRIPLDRPA